MIGSLTGTWMPVIIVLSLISAYFFGRNSEPTWLMAVACGGATMSLVLGAIALVQMSRQSLRRACGEHPSAFLVSLLWHKVMVGVVLWGSFVNCIQVLSPGIFGPFTISQELVSVFIIGSAGAITPFNLLLFYGRKRGWIEAPTDPLPGRALWRMARQKSRV